MYDRVDCDKIQNTNVSNWAEAGTWALQVTIVNHLPLSITHTTPDSLNCKMICKH